jgi:lipopolysaccharide biosynthesis glycosyltransferase
MEAGIPGHAPYFNSGVLVLDIQRWLDRDVTRAITNYLVDYGDRANLADQEAVNVAVYGDWVSLDRTWNYVTYVADYFLQEPEAEPSSPCIAHFAGRSKPWSFERPPLFTDEWFEVLTETPWAGFSPENARRRARSKWRRGMRRIGQNFKGR